MFLSSLRVQTSQDFIQILGLLDDLIGIGINIKYSTVAPPPPSTNPSDKTIAAWLFTWL